MISSVFGFEVPKTSLRLQCRRFNHRTSMSKSQTAGSRRRALRLIERDNTTVMQDSKRGIRAITRRFWVARGHGWWMNAGQHLASAGRSSRAWRTRTMRAGWCSFNPQHHRRQVRESNGGSRCAGGGGPVSGWTAAQSARRHGTQQGRSRGSPVPDPQASFPNFQAIP